jgi:hypothetical protein
MKQKNMMIGFVVIILIVSTLFLSMEKPSTYSIISKMADGEVEMIVEPTTSAMAIVTEALSCSPFSPYTGCAAFRKYDTLDYFNKGLSARVDGYSNVFMPHYSDTIYRYFTGGRGTRVAPYDTQGINSLYYTESCHASWTSFWSAANCTKSGCSGLTLVSNPNERVLVDGYNKSYFGCPTYVSFTRNIFATGSQVEYVGAAYYGRGVGTNGQSLALFTKSPVADCSVGQTKCEETNYYTCVNERWANQGQVDGKCGYFAPECQTGQELCEGSTLKKCEGGAWQYYPNHSNCATPVCNHGQTQCDGTTLKTCVNNTWQLTPNSVECGWAPPTVCEEGETQCDGTTLFVCQNNKFNNAGQVEGYCGYSEGVSFDMGSILLILGIFVIIGLVGTTAFIMIKKKRSKR